MSAGTSASFCLIVCFLVCSSGAQTNIRAELGQEVVLPCKVLNKNKTITAVKWSRPDQDPEYVLLYRDGRLYPDNQHSSYQNRVDLQDEEMKDGDVSLILKNVTKNDTGRYECRVFHGETNRRKRSSSDPINIINLKVLPPGNGIIILYIVGGIAFLLVVAAVGFWLYKRHRRQNQHRPVPAVEPPRIEMPTLPEVPPEQPTASAPLMERPAEEQSEM